MAQKKPRTAQEKKDLRDEIRAKTLTYVTAAFGLVAGLAWNDAVEASIDIFFPLPKDSLVAKFIYAIAITAVFVLITMYITRILKKI